MKYLLLIALFATSLSVSAQQSSEPCGTMPMLEEQLQSDPGLAGRMAEAEDRIQQFIARNKGNRSGANVITIPVVFHIVHNGEPVGTGRNISDAQVQSQLDIMNEDFRRLNADTVKLRQIFHGVAADPQIEFCLATLAPDGSPTNGINRVNGGRNDWPRNDIQNDLKPSTVWDSRLYLNFWVVDFGPSSNLLGYAQFPGGSPLTDGIVVGYRYIGRPPHNPVPNSYNYGRTATHEVGHWLNLRHIWGDGPCSDDDFVDDTPVAGASNFDCPVGINSCTEIGDDLPDMVENFMDYTRDTCMNTFTQGQADRMRAAINTERVQLLTSPGCSNVPTFAFTGQIIDTATGKGVPFAKVELQGVFTYTVEADTSGYFSIPYLLEGTYRVFAGAWGYETAYRPSDTLDPSITGYTIGIGEGYRDDFVLDLGWMEESTASRGTWTRGAPVGTFSDGQPFNPETDVFGDLGEACCMTGNGGGGSGNDDVDDGETILTSPYFDLTGFTDPKLTFYRWFQVGGGNSPSNDSLLITLTNGLVSDTLEIVTRNSPDLGQWIYREYQIGNYMTLTDSMRLILRTADRNPGHLVEAALDAFQIADSLLPVALPVASFTADGDTICSGRNIRFTNTSTHSPNTIQWHFPGGSPAQTTALNPQVSYDTSGTFDATLIVGNAAGFDTLMLTNVVTVYPMPDVSLTTIPIQCHADTNGTLTVDVMGGTPPFSYAWNTGDTSGMLDNLFEGIYRVTVTDGHGCGNELVSTLIEPTELKGGTATTPDDGTGSGEALASAVGGTAPYTFTWSDGSTGNHITGLSAGSYTVTISDSHGCQIIRSVVVQLQIGIQNTDVFKGATIVPNPATDQAVLRFSYHGQGNLQITVFNVVGQQMMQFEREASPELTIPLDIGSWSSGWYMVEIADGHDKLVMPLVKARR